MAEATKAAKSSSRAKRSKASAKKASKRSAPRKKAEPKPHSNAAQSPEEAAGDVQPVQVNDLTRRSNDDVLYGHFADVVSGEHKGRYGVYERTATYAKDGYPDTVVFRTRDAQNEELIVKHSDLRPAFAGRR